MSATTELKCCVPRVSIIAEMREKEIELMQRSMCRPGAWYFGRAALWAFDGSMEVMEARRHVISEPMGRTPGVRVWQGVPIFEVLDDPMHFAVLPLQADMA